MIIVLLVLVGLMSGSFVHALTWRLHEQETKKKLTKKQRQALSIMHGRSMCSRCGHELAWYDLVPVVSWALLRGRCRYCGRSIQDNPLVELITAGLFVWSYLAWPHGFAGEGMVLFIFWLLFLVGFGALAVYDFKWMELPNKVVYPLVALALVQVAFLAISTADIVDVLSEALWGFLAIGGLFYALFQVSGGKWIGGGDVKLGFMIGPLVGGPVASLLVIFVASLIGTLASLPFLAKKSLKTTSRIPFGPFLLIATVLIYLYGNGLVDWYMDGLL